MIYFSAGLPGPFSDWCDAVLAELVRRAWGDIDRGTANTPDELAAHFVRMRVVPAVIRARQPNGALRKILAETGIPFLLAVEHPREVAAHLITSVGRDVHGALKETSNSCACLVRFADMPAALRLDAGADGADPVATVQAIAGHFGLEIAENDAADIIESVRADGLSPERTPIEGWWGSLDPWKQRLIAGALDGFATYFATGLLGVITWHRELFQNGDTHQILTGPIDLTGRPRGLTFGPYMVLPMGAWTVHVVFGCSKETARSHFLIDVYAGTRLSSGTLEPEAGGIYEVTLEFVIEEATDPLVEVRLFSERAMFEGRVSLGTVTFVPRDEKRGHISMPELAAELGLETR